MFKEKNLPKTLSFILYLGFIGLSIWESYRPQKAIKEIFKEELPTWAFLTLLFLSFLYFKNKKYFDKSPEEGMVL